MLDDAKFNPLKSYKYILLFSSLSDSNELELAFNRSLWLTVGYIQKNYTSS